MAEGAEPVPTREAAVSRGNRRRRWGKRLGWVLAILLAPFVLAAAFFATPIGKRLIADQIAAVAPASGLRFTVGRIEGENNGDPESTFIGRPAASVASARAGLCFGADGVPWREVASVVVG